MEPTFNNEIIIIIIIIIICSLCIITTNYYTIKVFTIITWNKQFSRVYNAAVAATIIRYRLYAGAYYYIH
jgi:hypothetical protein